MALTPAEKQKQYRQRLKDKAAGLVGEPVAPLPLNLPISGFAAYILADKERAESYDWIQEELTVVRSLLMGEWASDDRIPTPTDDVAKLHAAIGGLTESLEYLTGWVNEFRQHQIVEEISRTKREDLVIPQKQDEALARIVRLTEVRKRLEKQYRLSLPEYQVTDD